MAKYYSVTAGSGHNTVSAARKAEVRALKSEGGGSGGIDKEDRFGRRFYRTIHVSGPIRYNPRMPKAKRRNTPRKKNLPARNSIRLSNFTGKVARLASGQVQVHGVQLKKPNPARRKRK